MPLTAPAFYRRNLPHWHPGDAAIFITWRLYASLPRHFCTARNGCATSKSAGERFKRMDRFLDTSTFGPNWLRQPRVATIVAAALLCGYAIYQLFDLDAFVIMPNHVHILIRPRASISRITNGLKGSTARDANLILGRTGSHFWQDESYDHWVRGEREFARIRAYIEYNPVSARLVAHPADWPWSSASRRVSDISST